MATNASQSVFVKKSMNLTTLVMENTRNSSLFGGHSNGNNNSNNYNNVYANGSSDYETKNDRSTAANLLIERLHGKSIQMRSWQDLSKTTKQNVQEKKIAPDDKFQMQKCLDIIQKNIEIKSVQSMKERLETICRQLNVTHNLNLKFNFTKSFECFISSDMFYIEIGLDQKTGQVLDCKVAHDNEETKSCPELVTVLQNRNFAEFTCHLEGLSSIFQIGAEKKTKTKIYSALQSLETDLLKMYEFQLSRINITSNLIHRSPAGIVEPRKGGTPMKLTFFVSPYQLIDLKTKTKLPLTVETITTKRIGFSATISIEESAVQQKLQSESLFYTTVSDNGQPMPHFHQNKNANSNMLPARFILKLSKPLPISLEIARKINCLTGIELTDSGGCEPRSLISLIAQQTLGRKANSPFYTKLPDQQHCYHVNETEMVKGILVEKIPFTHPTNVPRILNDLRLQIMFNVILGSLVRQVHGPVKNCKIFEISTSNLLSIFIQFENPKEQSLATLEIDLRDFTPTGVKCQLYPNFLANCSDTFHTKILQKSLSIPITLRAILNKATGNVRSLSTGNKKDLGASAASSTLAEDVHGNNEEPNKTNGHSNKLEDGGKTNNVHQSKDARQANNAMTAGGDTYLRNMLSDVPHASPKKRKRPPGMEPIESSNKKRNLNQTTDQHEETLGTGAGQKANEFGANTVDKLNDKSLFAVKAGGGGDINKQVMRKLSAGSLGRSILTMSSVSAGGGGGGGGANSLKSPESMESFIGGDQMSRKDRKRKRTELEAKVYNIDSDLTITPLTSSSIPSASLSDMAVTNSSMKGNNLANIAASADLMITSSNAAAAAASVAKSKKSAVLPLPTGTKTNAAQLLKLNAMLKQKNAVSHQQQQQMKMMVNPEMTAAMAVAAGGPPFDPTFIQAFAQAAAVAAANVANAVRLQNKQQVKQQQQQSKSLANLIGATSSSSSPSAKHQTQTTSGNKTKEQQSKASGVTSSSATGNLSLKQKNLPTSPNFAVATKITSPSLGGSSQQSLFQIAQSTSTSSSVPTSSSSSASTSTTGAGGAKNALKPAKKASINSVLERLSALRQNAGGDISEGIVSSAVALAAASAETMTVTSSSSSKNGDGNTNLFSKASGQNASSSTSTGSGGSKQTGGDNQQKQKYTIKGGTGLKTIITKNKSMAPSSTLTTSSSSSTADLLSKMSSGAALKTKYTIPKIPKASSSVTSSSSSSSTPSTAAAISSTNNSITSPPLSTSSSGSSSGGSSPSIKKSLTNNNNSHKLVSSSSPSLVPGQSKPINMKTGSSSGGTSSFPIKATTPNSKQTKTITSPDSHANKSSTKTVVDRSSATTKTTTTTTATTNQWNAAVPTTTLATTPAAAVPTNDVSISSSTTTLDSAIDVAPKVTTSAVLPQIEALPLLTAADDKKAPVVDVVVSSSSNSSSANSGADDGPRSLGKFELASIAAPATGGDSNNNGNGEESSDKASKSTAAVTTVEPSPSLPDTSDTLTTTTSLKYD